MKIKAYDTTNLLYNILNTDILYIQFTNSKKELNSNEVHTSQISICLNYENQNIYNAFKKYQKSGNNNYLQGNGQPEITEHNVTFKILNKNLIQLDFTANMKNNFTIVKVKDVCISPDLAQNTYIYNNINYIKDEVLRSSFDYFQNMINIKSSLIYILNDIDDKIIYEYININKDILNISVLQPYFKYTSDEYSTEKIIISDYTLAVYDKIFEINSIDYTETDFIFRFYIKIDDKSFLLNTNNVYCNQYTVDVNSPNNIISHTGTYNLKIYEKINDSLFNINDIIFIHDNKQNIKYIAKINNINTSTNILTLTNIQNKINVDTTVSTIDDIIITNKLNLKNQNDTFNDNYFINLLKKYLPVETYIIESDDYLELMKIKD